MKAPKGLPINVLEIRAERPPRRQLEISCNVHNPAPFDIYILDAWVKVEVLNGLKVTEGKLFHSFNNKIDPAIIPAGESGSGAFVIELPATVLKHVEERRAGGDIKLVLSSRVLISEICVVNGVKALGLPFETQFRNGRTDNFEYLIPQSEWVKVLKSLEWSELEILELPASRLRSNPTLARALQRFEDALECYRRGDWAETMLNCRKVFEAMVQDVTGTSEMRKAHQTLESIIGEGKKADSLDKMIKALNNFLHLGRHEQPPPISIKRADAQLALHLTGPLLTYLGEH